MPRIIDTSVDLDAISDGRFTPGARVAGTDGTVSVQLPGLFPGRIVHIDASAKSSVVDGKLAADAPLRFLRVDGKMRAESLDASLVYEAHERVTAAAPWRPTPDGAGCCAWWEHTLWRAAPGKPGAGLLRAVTPPLRDWSVLDWHLPNRLEPAWRVHSTDGADAVVAAAVSPNAAQLVVALADASGASVLRAHATEDGTVAWTTKLDGAVAEWRRGDGRLGYSADGARIVVLVEDRARCETCTALHLFDSASGRRLHTAAVKAVMSPRFTTIGISGDAVWIFEYVPREQSDMSTRPERRQYEHHEFTTGKHRTLDSTAPEWGLRAQSTWALLPRFGTAGVIGLGTSAAGTLTIVTGDRAP